MPSAQRSVDAFAVPPDPGQAATLDELVQQLRLLKAWAGDPSYDWITGRVNAVPTREQISLPVQEQLIVELYSK